MKESIERRKTLDIDIESKRYVSCKEFCNVDATLRNDLLFAHIYMNKSIITPLLEEIIGEELFEITLVHNQHTMFNYGSLKEFNTK